MNTIFVLALKVVFILPHVNCKTIVVALDGFRWDYVFRYKDDLPVLNKLLQKSTFLDKGIINAFPTLTFPNMWTYMTGVWPEDHGIISNSFYNRKLKRKFSMAELDYRFWKAKEPIWMTAERANVTSVVIHYPGAGVEAFTATYSYPEKINLDPSYSVVYLVDLMMKAFYNETNPADLGIMYIGEPDHVFHMEGPDTMPGIQKLIELDYDLKYLLEKMHSDDNLLLISDHGVTYTNASVKVTFSRFISERNLEAFTLDGPVAYLYCEKTQLQLVKNEVVEFKRKFPKVLWYVHENIPKRWNLAGSSNAPDILIVLPYHWIWNTNTHNGKLHRSNVVFGPVLERTVPIETKKVMVYVCMAQVTEGACQKGEEGLDTLQAAEPPCSVSNGPVKINIKTSVSGGLIYKSN